MNIEITDADIEQMVKTTMLKAGLGRVITETATKVLADHHGPIYQAVKDYVLAIAGKLLRQNYADQVEAIVKAEIEKRITAEMMASITGAVIEKMERAATDRY